MSVVRLLVLGVIREQGKAHGYAVHRELMTWHVDTWTRVKPGSIYHTLKQLAKEEKIHSVGTVESPEGPGRTVYQITAAGEADFVELLERALQSVDIEEFGGGFAFMQCLPRKRVIALLRMQLQQTEAVRDGLEAMIPSYPVLNEAPHIRELLALWSRNFGSNAGWTRSVIGRLESGEFLFPDDS